jgi:hypothetical protein
VPLLGAKTQLTAPEHALLALTVAVKVAVWPVLIVRGDPFTVTLVTVQVGVVVPPLFPPPQAESSAVPRAINRNCASHCATIHLALPAPAHSSRAIFFSMTCSSEFDAKAPDAMQIRKRGCSRRQRLPLPMHAP